VPDPSPASLPSCRRGWEKGEVCARPLSRKHAPAKAGAGEGRIMRPQSPPTPFCFYLTTMEATSKISILKSLKNLCLLLKKMGCSQAVRHGVLISAFLGSNPSTPANTLCLSIRVIYRSTLFFSGDRSG
jgi:hypothetical protein